MCVVMPGFEVCYLPHSSDLQVEQDDPRDDHGQDH